MTNSKSKVVATQNTFSIFLTFTFWVLLTTKVKSESISFNIPRFEEGSKNLLLEGATVVGGALQLTPRDRYGHPIQHSAGYGAFWGAVHVFDRTTRKTADFITDFSFVVNKKGAPIHGDGFTFFMASTDFDFPDNSTGGFLGLFDEETAFNTSKNQVVAVEFDTFANVWDPNYPESDSPHIGIDINSLKSVATVAWPIDAQPEGAIGRATISYESYSKVLAVSVAYPNTPAIVLSNPVNFAAVNSEWVLIGFTGTTGDEVETHDILSWSFRSFL